MAANMDDILDEAKRFLQKDTGAGLPTLHEHLTQVLLKIIVERPENANTLFESLSLELRRPSTEGSEIFTASLEEKSGNETVEDSTLKTTVAAMPTAEEARNAKVYEALLDFIIHNFVFLWHPSFCIKCFIRPK